MDAPSVAIVLVNWNNLGDTLECLGSLAGQDYAQYGVILVDNGSTDGSIETFRARPDVDFLENGENLGIARANNVGIARARERGFDLVMLLNNDTVVAPDMLSRLVAVLESAPGIGVVGPKMYYHAEPEVLWFAGGRVHPWRGDTSHVGYQEKDRGQHDRQGETDYVTSCCLLARTALFKELGGIDPFYFIYFDETDFCLRAARAGYAVVYVPSARLWHKISRSMGGMGSARYWFQYMRSRAYFVGKLYPWPNKAVALACMCLWDTPRMLAHFAARAAWDRIPAFVRGLAQGLAAGLEGGHARDTGGSAALSGKRPGGRGR